MIRIGSWAATIWAALSVTAQDVVVVRKGLAEKATIDLAGLAVGGGPPTVFMQVLRSDLDRSGWFRVAGGGAEFRVSGDVAEAGGQVTARLTLTDAGRGAVLLGRSYSGAAPQVRALAHRAADDIVKAVTGREGFASSRLVVVGNRTGRKELYICDSDGQNLVQLTQDRSISLYPRWGGADNEFITYTSYLRGYPAAWRIRVTTGERHMLAGFPGLNAGPALSPDGRAVALILSRDGNPELYVQSPPGGGFARVTRTPTAAESSPTWSPDGSQICYVSDESGKPQLYIVSRAGGPGRRVTSRGVENVAPDWGPDGRIVFATGGGSRFRLAVLDPSSLASTLIGFDDASYEDPSWARNGRHVACARVEGHRSAIWLIDTVSGERIPLLSGSGDWFSPDWTK